MLVENSLSIKRLGPPTESPDWVMTAVLRAEKNYTDRFIAIRIFGMSRAPGPITCQPGMGLSEVRGAVFPSQQGGIPNLR